MAARTVKPRNTESVLQRIRASQLVEMLNKHAVDGADSKIDPTRIKAAEILLARVLPVLSAVEQTTINPDDALTEGQIILKFQSLISAFPDLREKLLAEPVRVAPGVPNTEPETVTH